MPYAEKYIKDHQDALVVLADSLLQVLGQEDLDNIYTVTEDPSLTNICKTLYRSFEEILHYIEIHCVSYYSQSAMIPYVHRMMAAKELEPRLDAALEAIRGLSNPKSAIRNVFTAH